ncbi:MAG: TadE/TadG family type IV pilus assembly protein [Clostridiaceae bacterium]
MRKISGSFSTFVGLWAAAHIRSEKGTTAVMVALCMTVLLGFCALGVDIGVVAHERSRISNAVDSAALAGAQELIYDRDNACNVAKEYLEKNGIDPLRSEIVVFDNDTKVSVTANEDVDHYFARILGFNKTNVKATGVAECAPLCGVGEEIRPFAIEQQTFEYGVTYTLKEGGGEGFTGNYGALKLNKTGSSTYGNNIINGYNGFIKVDEILNTEPGNMAGDTVAGVSELLGRCNHSPECTYDHYEKDCPRLITVIIINAFQNGRSDVTVMGFAKFLLEGVTEEGHGTNSKAIVTGKFVKAVGVGKVSPTQTDYGFKGIRLIQ